MFKKLLLWLALSRQERYDLYNILLECNESKTIGESGFNSKDYERIILLRKLFKIKED